MVTMLLVEDEAFERASLRNCIDWELIGVRIIDEAANGAQGLNKVMELHPDIVLTDIKMPVMNGIEMSKNIRDISPSTKILFISSYDDFEYAKQAVNLQAAAFVTKPVNEGELLKTVKRAADEITEMMLERSLNKKLKNSYEVNLNLARQAILNRAVTGLYISPEDAASLGLAWLSTPQVNLCLILSIFKKEGTKSVDAHIETLNHRTKKLFRKSVCACINAGVLVTIVASHEAIFEQDLSLIKETVSTFLKELGCENPKIKAECARDESASPVSLYLKLLQNDMGFISPIYTNMPERKNKQQIVDDVLQIVHSQYKMPLTVESIAKSLHFTPNYIGSVFKSIKNVRFNHYLKIYRLERAKDLLQNENLHIDEIALQCGYNNITYFYTIFKREYGITPNEFRLAAT